MYKRKTKDAIADEVKKFYNEVPFPGYDHRKYNSRLDLYKNANIFARRLDHEIPYNARVVDIGCGTGQMASFLSLKDREVLGLDFSSASLEKAKALADKLGLPNVSFGLADVLALPKPEYSFDYIFCCGVLHHTSDPYRGFTNILKYGKSGSYVILGLYNRYGRSFLKLKRFLHNKARRLSSGKRHSAAAGLHGKSENDEEKDYSWFLDQYEHPYESSHTVGEVLEWFKDNDLDYVYSIPPLRLFRSGGKFSNLFGTNDGTPRPGAFLRFLAQMKWIVSLRKTGGYFVTIGRIR